jgi:hypothetical protein
MARTGRPRIEIPMAVVDAACQFNPSIDQVLEVLHSQGHQVSVKTLQRVIKATYGMTFDAYRDKKTAGTRLKLAQKAVKMGLEGHPALLIFCLKSLCGWSETSKVELTGANGGPVETAAQVQIVVTIPSNGREAQETKP